MKSILLPLLFCTFSFLKGQAPSKETINDPVSSYDQYAFLLERSFTFIYKNSSFITSLHQYIKKQGTLSQNESRLEPIICHPFLLDASKKRALVLLLQRSKQANGERIEEFYLASAKKSKKTWLFQIADQPYEVHYYTENALTLPDQQLCFRLVSKMIEQGYLQKASLDINNAYFQATNGYVFD